MNADPDSYVDGNGQLYNMGFDLWCYEDGDAVFYDSLATDEQKKVWGSANSSTASFGKPTCVPDSVMVAVEGPGKYAVKLKTQQINALFVKKLAAGNTIKPFHAYLAALNSESSVTSFSIDNDLLGIEGVSFERVQGNRGVYSLGGQLVGHSTVGLPKGVYIVNGRKVVVK